MAVGWSPAGGKGWWSLKGEFGYWMTSILPPVFGSGKWRIIAKRSSENFQTTADSDLKRNFYNRKRPVCGSIRPFLQERLP